MSVTKKIVDEIDQYSVKLENLLISDCTAARGTRTEVLASMLGHGNWRFE